MAVQGPIPVQFSQMYPHGAYAAGVIEPVRDFDASKDGRFVQAKDRESGLPLWAVDVIDADPAARIKTARVKIAASEQPALPPASPGNPFAAGGTHRPGRHPLCQPGGAAGLLPEGHRDHPGPRCARQPRGRGPLGRARPDAGRDGRELAPSGRPRSLPLLGVSFRKR